MNRALLVGINAYPPPNELRGCVNDVHDMAGFLVSKCAFAHDDIRLLTDRRAAARNIFNHLDWLCHGLGNGDRILFHYSGHGAQVAGRDSSGHTDRIDEVICPVDFSFDDDSTMIRDKDFVRLFGEIPEGVECVWVSDSCFSGGLTKAMVRMPFNVKELKFKTFEIPADIAWRNETAAAKNLTPLGMKGAATRLGVALISGCTATQESADADIKGRFNGALTYYLLDVLSATDGLKQPLTHVVETVVDDLKRARFTQHPELLGSRSIGKRPFLAA
jgi:hypothetical protein